MSDDVTVARASLLSILILWASPQDGDSFREQAICLQNNSTSRSTE